MTFRGEDGALDLCASAAPSLRGGWRVPSRAPGVRGKRKEEHEKDFFF